MVLTSSAGSSRANATYGKGKNIRFGGPRKPGTSDAPSSVQDDSAGSGSDSDKEDRGSKAPLKKLDSHRRERISNNVSRGRMDEDKITGCKGASNQHRELVQRTTARSKPNTASPVLLSQPKPYVRPDYILSNNFPPSSSPLSSPPPLHTGSSSNRSEIAQGQPGEVDSAASTARRHPNRKASLAAQARVQTLLQFEESEKSQSKLVSRTGLKDRKSKSAQNFKSVAARSSSRSPVKSVLEDMQKLTLNGTDRQGDDVGLSALLSTCGQKRARNFTRVIEEILQTFPRAKKTVIEKAGEASYSEVFRIQGTSNSSHLPSTSILKVIPLRRSGSKIQEHSGKTGRERRTTSSPSSNNQREEVIESLPLDVKREVDITRRLAKLTSSVQQGPQFVQLLSAQVTTGAYPSVLLDAWDRYDTRSGGSENARPQEGVDEGKDGQLYCLLHLSDGGEDVESVHLSSWVQALTIFAQTVHLLARAEKSAEFEHRDLHWGNILVEKTSVEEVDVSQSIAISWSHLLDASRSHLRTTIIDYTLSKARLSDSTLASCDLYSNRSLFLGDAEEDYQFEIYRLMKRHVRILRKNKSTKELLHGKEKEEGEEDFYPGTNVLWCHYLLRKLLEEKELEKPRGPLGMKAGKGTISSGGRLHIKKVQPTTYAEAERIAFNRLVALEAMLKGVVEQLRRGVNPSSPSSHGDSNGRMVASSVQLQEFLEKAWR